MLVSKCLGLLALCIVCIANAKPAPFSYASVGDSFKLLQEDRLLRERLKILSKPPRGIPFEKPTYSSDWKLELRNYISGLLEWQGNNLR